MLLPMRRSGWRWMIGGVAAASLMGCATMGPGASAVGGWAARTLRPTQPAGDVAASVVSTDVETVDLTAALVVHCPREQRAVASLDEAYLRFEECAPDPDVYRRRRTQLQERLAAASNAQCGTYKRRLREAASAPAAAGPTASGSLARAAIAGLGMAAPPVAVAKGLADAVKVVRAPATPTSHDGEDELTRRVVALGIDTRRAVLLQAIRRRQQETMDAYPVQTAVADALAYHDACSAVGGLEAAADALAQTDPGVGETRTAFAHDAVETAVAAIGRTREQLDAQRDRLTSLLVAAEDDAPDETDAAHAAIRTAGTVCEERAAEAATARERARALVERLESTTDPRLRTSLLADVDVEVSRAVRASAEADEAYAAARAAVDVVAARVAPLDLGALRP